MKKMSLLGAAVAVFSMLATPARVATKRLPMVGILRLGEKMRENINL